MFGYIRKIKVGPVADHCGGCVLLRLKFTIEKDGSLSNVSIQDRHCCFNNIAASLIPALYALPKWKPARLGGETVRCYYMLPIRIRVN